MKTWFTADLHLGHGNIIKYCNRPWLTDAEKKLLAEGSRKPWRVSEDTVRRHDDALLDAINSRVAPDDLLWILGDFAWGRTEEVAAYRSRILCRDVRLVWGNHDRRDIAPCFSHCIEQGMINVQGQDIWLCHYPLRTWNKRFHGSWSLYGHVHGKMVAEDERNPTWLTKDMGVDACDYRPWSYEELSDYMGPRLEAFWKLREENADIA